MQVLGLVHLLYSNAYHTAHMLQCRTLAAGRNRHTCRSAASLSRRRGTLRASGSIQGLTFPTTCVCARVLEVRDNTQAEKIQV